MLATVSTGIRPVEWLTANWVDDSKTAIEVKTAKRHISEAAFCRKEKVKARSIHIAPVKRVIPVGSEDDRLLIDSHIGLIRDKVISDKMTFAAFHKKFVQVMSPVSTELWNGDKCYTTYHGRKQFSANKKAEFGAVIAADLMGHSRADSPSASSYGNAKQAYIKPIKVKRRRKEINVEVLREEKWKGREVKV